jgi:hypothetical protein
VQVLQWNLKYEQAAQHIGINNGFTAVLMCIVPHISIQKTQRQTYALITFLIMHIHFGKCNAAIQYGFLCLEFNYAIP